MNVAEVRRGEEEEEALHKEEGHGGFRLASPGENLSLTHCFFFPLFAGLCPRVAVQDKRNEKTERAH